MFELLKIEVEVGDNIVLSNGISGEVVEIQLNKEREVFYTYFYKIKNGKETKIIEFNEQGITHCGVYIRAIFKKEKKHAEF